MKKIGFVGGISWTSTLDYYEKFNQGINERLGGLNSGKCVVYSLNFADIQDVGWLNSFELIYNACKSLTESKVDGIVLCANTAHMFADQIEKSLQTPIIHMVSATATKISETKLNRVGLLGTRFTMEMDFYKKKLKEFAVETIVPGNESEIEEIHRIVKDELGKGIVLNNSKEILMNYALRLIELGAEGIILGCTEIPLILSQKDFNVPVFDTTKIHVESIIDFALQE